MHRTLLAPPDPSRRSLIGFGVCWLVGFGILGALLWARGVSPRVTGAVWLIAVLVPSLGWVSPKFSRIVYRGTATLTWPLACMVSYTVLAGAFYLVLVPTALVMRVLGHDPMSRRFDKQAESYWIRRKPARDPRRYFRQY